MDFNGKVAIVTGGADGIGKAITRALLDVGMKVCICDINESAAKSLLAELSNKFENNIYYVKCDVSNYDELKEAFEKTKKAFGRIDVVMNNAGIFNEHEWKKTIDINIVGLMYGVHLAFEHMDKNLGGFGGKIINTASTSGFKAVSFAPTYCASKHAVVGLTKSYGDPYHFDKTGVTVNAVCPGPIDTQLFRNFPKLALNKEVAEAIMPSYKTTSTSEVAKAVIKLLQDGKNGALLQVDSEGIRYIE